MDVTTDERPRGPSTVALVRCDGYDPSTVHAAVGRGLDLLGGVGRFAEAGERILLKPNLLVASAPGEAVTTHPEVFRAVSRHLAETGAELSYGDSPAFGGTRMVARRAGIEAVAQELGVRLAQFGHPQTVSFPSGGLIKQFDIAQAVLDADGLVSLPKLKTHALTRMTGAIKNQFGCVPGMRKGTFHVRMPDAEHFAQMLVDLNRLLRPRLFVMDGIVAMEGNGPRGGDPRPLGALLLSTDPVALDACACRIIGLDPQLVDTIRWGGLWGLGEPDDMQLLGDPLESFYEPDFRVDRKKAPSPTRPGLRSRIARDRLVPRPVIDPNLCTACHTCVKMCPVTPKALTRHTQSGRVGEGDAPQTERKPPTYDYSVCIRCYCCQETCPEHAIFVKTPLLGRLIHS